MKGDARLCWSEAIRTWLFRSIPPSYRQLAQKTDSTNPQRGRKQGYATRPDARLGKVQASRPGFINPVIRKLAPFRNPSSEKIALRMDFYPLHKYPKKLISEASRMIRRPLANSDTVAPLLRLIERRFSLRLPTESATHLKSIQEHYDAKRMMLLWEHGEAEVLKKDDYAKAVLISETIRLLLLREIDPWPRRKKNKKGTTNDK